MRTKPAHTLLKPVLMWIVIITYLTLGDPQVTQMIALALP